MMKIFNFLKLKIRQLKFDIRVYFQSRGKLKVKVKECYIYHCIKWKNFEKDDTGYLDCFSGGCAIVVMNVRPKYLWSPYPGQYIHKIPCDKIIVIN